jgi:hypothetical protein
VHKLQDKIEQERITGQTEVVNEMLQDNVCGGVEATGKTETIKKL